MTEPGAIGLVLSDMLTLSFDVIRLIDVERDDAVAVTTWQCVQGEVFISDLGQQ
jgi:hypothetical protein